MSDRTIATGTGRSPKERQELHELKVMELIRGRFRDAVRSRSTGKLVIEIQLNKGGPTNTYTEVSITHKILEETS